MFAKLFDQAQSAPKPTKKSSGPPKLQGKIAKKSQGEKKGSEPVNLSKSQRKKLAKKQKQCDITGNQQKTQQQQQSKPLQPQKGGASEGQPKKKGADSLQAKMKASQFRHLNETLYTTESASAWDLFQQEWLLSP